MSFIVEDDFTTQLFAEVRRRGCFHNDEYLREKLGYINKKYLKHYVVGDGAGDAKCKYVLEYFSKKVAELQRKEEGHSASRFFYNDLRVDKTSLRLTKKPSEQIQALFLLFYIEFEQATFGLIFFNKLLYKAKGCWRANKSRKELQNLKKKAHRSVKLKLSKEVAEGLKKLQKNQSDDNIICAAFELFNQNKGKQNVNESESTFIQRAAQEVQHSVQSKLDEFATLVHTEFDSLNKFEERLQKQLELHYKELNTLTGEVKALMREVKRKE